ncbi:cytochrome c peroxidase [Methylomicrobium sp. Wu6]|uniref:cytochrome c peroxidase n=1 Tax=Methylomicrobium sp. Wu6 TaxID=3107928 RepID=UPI002DD63CEA|nr:cytochrome c peroxidase [Methylomicrobium sp. Wu6]MEC4750578.1 cytochrome c peroxidase [Methylomicrobium sp. Wu6]
MRFRGINIQGLLVCLLVANRFLAADLRAADQPPLAPGYGNLQFTLPEPGTYQLPPLGEAADGNVLDSHGNALKLHDLLGGKVVLLSFVYSTCNDVNGCPLATAVLHKIKQRLAKEADIAAKLRLITFSFNPEHDTPEMMAKYGEEFQAPGVEWHFLTTASEADLQPILDGYGHTVQKVYDAEGKSTGTFSHVLRVYLIDQDKRIRNIYSVSFLHADTLINDIRTLLTAAPKASVKKAASIGKPSLYQSGDNKSHYDSGDYQTHSVSMKERQGKSIDLLAHARKPILGLPRVPVPKDNPLTAAKIGLGRKLFYDRRLSLNKTFSCAMCHIPEQGFTNNEMATAVGVEGRSVRRNSPTLYNVAYLTSLFHDGRETTLEQQVWAPLLAHNEMANPSIGYVLESIARNADYHGLFQNAFGRGPSMETVGMAIASYERALNSAASPFDHWYYGKDKKALDEQAQLGFKLFTGKAQCSGCHTIDSRFALFTDNGFHNTGIGYAGAMGGTTGKQRVQVAPGAFVEVDRGIIASVSAGKDNDLGRYEVTQKPEDRWKYRTPPLRNVGLTAPYMHDGSLQTLEEVVRFYNEGGQTNENLDPMIHPLHLSNEEVAALVAFLKSLTGSSIGDLVGDAFAAPVGDAR